MRLEQKLEPYRAIFSKEPGIITNLNPYHPLNPGKSIYTSINLKPFSLLYEYYDSASSDNFRNIQNINIAVIYPKRIQWTEVNFYSL